jgi:hypothetical protein
MRLMEGADIYQIAKNCRASVEMIEKFYTAHIKNTLDAAAINVMRSRAAHQLNEVPKPSEGRSSRESKAKQRVISTSSASRSGGADRFSPVASRSGGPAFGLARGRLATIRARDPVHAITVHLA